jgi:23S rRNA (pseudouridine1915-N3)-methyltransferase
MKIILLFTGKTKISYISEGLEDYLGRLKHYINIDVKILPDIKGTKSLSADQVKKREGEIIIKNIPPDTDIVLFDERGKQFSSNGLSDFFQKAIDNRRDLCFVLGGAYGFSPEVYKKATLMMSFSKLTFSHQMIRMIIAEQFYRAFTILKNEPYHHSG